MSDKNPNYGYRVPEKSILTGTLAKKVQIKGRLEMEIGEIGATITLAIFLIVLLLATSFLGWDGLPLILRLSVIGLIGWGGKMAIFDHPGGMKYADWLWLWYRYRSRKQAGELDYNPERSRRARLRRAEPKVVERDAEPLKSATGVPVASGWAAAPLAADQITQASAGGGQAERIGRWERNNSAA